MGSVQDYHRLVEAVKATFHSVDAMVGDTTKLRAHLVKQIDAERRTEREIDDLEDTVRHVCLCCRSAALGGTGSRHDLLLNRPMEWKQRQCGEDVIAERVVRFDG